MYPKQSAWVKRRKKTTSVNEDGKKVDLKADEDRERRSGGKPGENRGNQVRFNPSAMRTKKKGMTRRREK